MAICDFKLVLKSIFINHNRINGVVNMSKKNKIIIGISAALIVIVIVAVSLALTLGKEGVDDTVRSRDVNNIDDLRTAIGEKLIVPKNMECESISVLYNTAVTKEYASSVSGYDEKASGYRITFKIDGVSYSIVANVDPAANVTLELKNKDKYEEKTIAGSGINTPYYVSKSDSVTYFVIDDGIYMIKGDKNIDRIENIVKRYFM